MFDIRFKVVIKPNLFRSPMHHALKRVTSCPTLPIFIIPPSKHFSTPHQRQSMITSTSNSHRFHTHECLYQDWGGFKLGVGIINPQLSKGIATHRVHQLSTRYKNWMGWTTRYLEYRNVIGAEPRHHMMWFALWNLFSQAQLAIPVWAPGENFCEFIRAAFSLDRIAML